MDDILSQIIAYAPDRIDTETKARAMVQGPRNMADGGRIGFKDGTPVKFDKTRVKIPTGKFIGEGRDKSQIFKIKNNNSGSIKYTTSSAGGGKKKLYNSIEEVKKAKLDFIPDELVKTDAKRIKENIQEVTYKNKKTGKITTKYKPFIGPDKVTIPGQGANTLKEAEGFVADYFKKNPKTIRVRDPQKDYASKDERRKFEKLKQGRMIKFGAGKGYTVHHMLPLAGKADVTTSDLAKISAKMNTELSQFDKPMNKLVNEAYALDFSKTESLKRMDEINKELADYVKKSVKKLGPEYKGLLGFNKLIPVLDTFDEKGNQVFNQVPKGLDFKKSIAGKKQGEAVRNIKTKDIQKMVSESGKTVSIKNISAIQSKGIAKKLDAAGFKCQLSNGLTCNDPRAYTKSIKENMAKIQQGDDAAIAKLNKLGKGMNAFKGAAKFTGWTLLAELGIAAPLAAVDYAKGANKDEIISNATYGLFGKSEDEQLREKYSDYGQAKDFQKTYDKLLKQESALDDQTGYGSIINPQNVKNTEKKLMEQSKQFDSVLPPSQGLRSEFDLGKFLNMVVTDQQRDKLFADQKAQREEERGILKPSTGLESYDNFMEGGIASLNVNKK